MNPPFLVNMPSQPASTYPIFVGATICDVQAWLPTEGFHQIVIVTDKTVEKLYGLNLQLSLQKAGHPCVILSFPAGEKHKNNKTKTTLENAMLAAHCGRDTLILALGGGVVGDLAGFIAATYLRGVPYIQLPTTLLAMVDSSVGGKTSINTDYGKNLIGAIYQPIAVVADITLLKSLSKKQRINGLIEALKLFLTCEATFFYDTASRLSSLIQGNEVCVQEMVSRAVTIKANVVERDEKEQGERSVLNFGHTIGHALEKISGYTLLHGYAVAYGILVEANLSHGLGLLSTEQLLKIKQVMSLLGIEGVDLKKYDCTDLLEATKNDKKNRSGKVQYILLKEIGRVHMSNGEYRHPVADSVVIKALKNTIEG